MTNFKDAAEDWEIALQLKSLLKARIAACILSPHIPEYKRSLVKHVTALLPPSAMHMLPDAGNSSHKKILNTFTGDYATSARNIVKTAIVKSMTRFDLEAGDDLLDVTQGWCIGKLCEEIVAKLGTDADIQVTSEVQGRVALLRFVFAAYPAKASGSQYWDLVDETLSSQRELSAAVMARDIAEGLKDDIKKYTGESWETYTLVDTKAVASDSLQACADKAMRDYYKTVKPLKKTVRAGGGK
ncbi:hypothetical protein EXIGLDRAFT_70730 [Exidia glandulosa HHB12029]|uniref:Uncharacterized protein n=1 Tax=Exidia glandulosa HHB12029 TaxID=1314781 RepID=A0A165HXV6_EXIGL|nr:hypothetical protein EXIGLDRAFT_70730 [Exidia glandulosa HHB12029]